MKFTPYGTYTTKVLAAILCTISLSDSAFPQGEEEETWVIFADRVPKIKGRKLILKEKISRECGKLKVTALLSKDGTRFEQIRARGKTGQLDVPEEILDAFQMPAKYSFAYSRDNACAYGREFRALNISFAFDVEPEILNDPNYYRLGEPTLAIIKIEDWQVVSLSYEVSDPEGKHSWVRHDWEKKIN